MATKDTPDTSATAVADPEERAPAPQSKEEIAATEQALGLSTTKENKPAPQRAAVRMGVAPTTIEEAWRLANVIASSELVPKGYRGRPADVLVAIQYGMEVGLPPMAALHSVFVTNGRPSLWGDGFLAVIMASARYKDHAEYYIVDGQEKEFLIAADLAKDDTMAVTTFWRTDSARPRTATFSIAKAKKAGLWSKKGPWQEYPDRMLKMRARGFAGHDAFPDVLRGIRTAEEARDTQDEDTAIDVVPVQVAPVQPRRASEALAEPSPTAVPPADQPAPAGTPASVPADATQAERFESRGISITNTQFVKPKTGEPYYEITTKAGAAGERTFLTRDESVYKEARSFEGTEHLVAVFFHKAKKDTTDVLVLDSLTIHEGAPAAASRADLFA